MGVADLEAAAVGQRHQLAQVKAQSDAAGAPFARGVGPVERFGQMRDHVFVDFQGELSMDKVRELLAGDESRDAKVLLARLTRDGGANDMMVALADCLLEVVQNALSDEIMKEQLRAYIEA